MRQLIIFSTYLLIAFSFSNCNETIENYKETGTKPAIFPDYIDVTIPYNIAPLNFKFKGEGEAFFVRIEGKNGEITFYSDKKIQIPIEKWKKLLEQNRGDSLKVHLFVKNNGIWNKYKAFTWFVAKEPIDSHLVYRLIEPGYVGFNEMGIYQRDIENFDEKAIIHNDLTERSCINCHAFCNKDPKKLMFHSRLRNAGTIIIDGDKIKKIDTKTSETIAAGTYPAWHPFGKFIAFSINKPQQVFHLNPERRAEISDIESDIVVLDIDKSELFSDPKLMMKPVEETFPSFTADGKRLIFATFTPSPSDTGYTNIRYSLCAIDFDGDKRKFGDKVDTLISASKIGKTVAFANASPDGKYILCSLANNGVFTSWNKESDLYLYYISSGELTPLTASNTDDSESYNTWSSNSSWIVLSSRRMDGHYNRPHITYVDSQGKTTKAFVMPQFDPDFYTMFLKIYNRPELITGPVTIDPYEIERVAKNSEIQKVTFKK